MPVLPAKYADCHQFRFGDGPELGDFLLSLVLEGKKTGTCWPLRDAETEPMVQVGERAVYTDWNGKPHCVVEYTKVEICRFDAVSVEFAESEAEGGYDGWRDGHITYLKRNGGFSPDMELVCETFRVVEVFS